VSRRTARRWLWVAALVTMPVPFYLGALEWAPVLRLAFLTGLVGLVVAAEGGSTTMLLGLLGVVQVALYAGLFFLAAGLAARALERIRSAPLRAAALGTAIFLLGASALMPIYETPLSSTRLRSNVLQIFE